MAPPPPPIEDDDDASLSHLGDTHRRRHNFLRRSQRGLSYVRWPTALTAKGSVLRSLLLPVALYTLWAAAVALLSWSTLTATKSDGRVAPLRDSLKLDPVALSVITGVMSLMLVFRNNVAYDRYYNGRKVSWPGRSYTSFPVALHSLASGIVRQHMCILYFCNLACTFPSQILIIVD